MCNTASTPYEELLKEVDDLIGLVMKADGNFVDDPTNTVVGPQAVKHEKAFLKATEDVFAGWREQLSLFMESSEAIDLAALSNWSLDPVPLKEVLMQYMQEGLILAGEAGIDKLIPEGSPINIRFDLVNTNAIKWLDSYTLSLSEKTANRLTGNIKQTLHESFMRGDSVANASKEVLKDFDDMKQYEAERLVRTEHSRAMSEGSLEGYKQAECEWVGYAIAEDEWACPTCRESAIKYGKAKLEDVAGLIPRHPNCRCCWVPLPDESED